VLTTISCCAASLPIPRTSRPSSPPDIRTRVFSTCTLPSRLRRRPSRGDTLAFRWAAFSAARAGRAPSRAEHSRPGGQLRVRAYFRKSASKVSHRPITPGFDSRFSFHGRHAAPRPSVFSSMTFGGGLLRAGAGLLGLVLRRADRSVVMYARQDRARDPHRARRGLIVWGFKAWRRPSAVSLTRSRESINPRRILADSGGIDPRESRQAGLAGRPPRGPQLILDLRRSRRHRLVREAIRSGSGWRARA